MTMSARTVPETFTSMFSRVALLEPALFHLDPISSGHEVEKLVVASGAGERLTPFAGSDVGEGNGCASQCAAGRIGDGADHRAIKCLAETGNR